MKFIIDAYNVIGQLDHIELSHPNKASLFIDWIERNKNKKDQMVLVFDGKNKWLDFTTTQHRQGIKIIHTPVSLTADDYIKQKIEKMSDRSNVVVVSSDQDICFFVKKQQVKVWSSKAFILYLLKKNELEKVKESPQINQQHIDYWMNEFLD
ncbi:MAG: NYN domain-containing protein [Candidatus Margulisiibacteriota bacterium]